MKKRTQSLGCLVKQMMVWRSRKQQATSTKGILATTFLSLFAFAFITSAFATSTLSAEENIVLPDRKLATALIYETIISVNNASQTQNYSVLRALAAPAFKKKYSDEKLEKTFGHLAKKGINLRPLILLTPTIQKSQYAPRNNLFRLKGFIPTAKIKLDFEMIYQFHQGAWRIYAIQLDFKNAPNQDGETLTLSAI